jgi:hypothetical protein
LQMRAAGDEYHIIYTGQSQPAAEIPSYAASAEYRDPHDSLRELLVPYC